MTIIDTPGYGDTSGIERDREITEQIREFVNSANKSGISGMHSIGFVANSSKPRLTQTDRYIYESILALFGKDIVNNIFMLLTFVDQKKPQVLAALTEVGTPLPGIFQVQPFCLF